MMGTISIPFSNLVQILLDPDLAQNGWNYIIWEIRFPRALTAFSCGISLSIAGLVLQTLFRNPLAGPSVLGISSGATLGVSLWLLAGGLGLSAIVSTAIAALIGSWMVLLLLIWIAGRLRDNVSLLIFGIMLSFLVGAFVNVLEFKSTDTALRAFINWGMGSFSHTGWTETMLLLLAGIIILIVLAFMVNPLNALLLGDDVAHSIGVSVKKNRIIIILLTGILVGLTTAYCGPIAFIGLAVPHIGRMILRTSDHRYLLPVVCAAGGTVSLICDFVAQHLVDGGLPINTVTSAIGAPIVMFLIFKGGKNKT